jgi:hypothetical protein
MLALLSPSLSAGQSRSCPPLVQESPDFWYFEGAHVAFHLLGAAAVAGGVAIAFLTFLGGPARAVHTLHGVVGLAVAGALLAQVSF